MGDSALAANLARVRQAGTTKYARIFGGETSELTGNHSRSGEIDMIGQLDAADIATHQRNEIVRARHLT